MGQARLIPILNDLHTNTGVLVHIDVTPTRPDDHEGYTYTYMYENADLDSRRCPQTLLHANMCECIQATSGYNWCVFGPRRCGVAPLICSSPGHM